MKMKTRKRRVFQRMLLWVDGGSWSGMWGAHCVQPNLQHMRGKKTPFKYARAR